MLNQATIQKQLNKEDGVATVVYLIMPLLLQNFKKTCTEITTLFSSLAQIDQEKLDHRIIEELLVEANYVFAVDYVYYCYHTRHTFLDKEVDVWVLDMIQEKRRRHRELYYNDLPNIFEQIKKGIKWISMKIHKQNKQ